MKNLLYWAVLLILLYMIFKPGLDYVPDQEEIQSDSYVDQNKSVQDFPYPQLSRKFKQLSRGRVAEPIIVDKSLPNGSAAT